MTPPNAEQVEKMRSLSMDHYIEWMLDNSWYAVDIDNCRVWNVRSGKVLKQTTNTVGYKVVGFVFCRQLVRQVKVHRLMCIAKYGANETLSKQVAHPDHTRDNNSIDNLWVAPTANDHIKYDGTHLNIINGRPPKTNWSPCVWCGALEGQINGHNKTPDRISGKRFGIEGKLCGRCYRTIQERERRANGLVKSRAKRVL